MKLLLPLAAVVLALSVFGFAFWLWRRIGKHGQLHAAAAATIAALGLVAGLCAIPFETWVLAWADIDLIVTPGAGLRANLEPILGMLLFCVPLEEAVKVGILWPLYLRGELRSGALGVAYAVFIASGFAAGEIIALSLTQQVSWLGLARALLSVPAHIFFAGLLGYVLGGRRRDKYFLLSFVFCVVVHAVYDHIVFARGPALLIVALPMFATMAWGLFALLNKDVDGSYERSSSRPSLFEAPSLGSVRHALERGSHTLKLQWILIGVFVNLGVTLTFLALAVYAGHRFHVDFALVEEGSSDATLPVLFLATGLLASFPVSAFLVARASGTRSVLEPAWAMGASIILVLALFSVTEPTAIVIAIGLAPVGFLLACMGAIFGLRRG